MTERVLDGSPVARAAVPAVGPVLTALTAPATEQELVGEHAALAAFRHATLAAPTCDRRTRMITSTVSKMLLAKLLAVGAAAAATGGIALASTTGALSGPSAGRDVVAPADTSTGTSTGTPTDGGTTSTSTGTSTDTATGTSTDTSTETSTSTDTSTDTSTATSTGTTTSPAGPSPSLVGLCHAYQAGALANPGKAAANPAFSALVTAAGGSDQLASYCTALVGAPRTHPTGRPTAASSSHPTGAPSSHATGAPSSHPAGAPSSHPTGAPRSHPTGAPSSHPTGAPSSHPTGR